MNTKKKEKIISSAITIIIFLLLFVFLITITIVREKNAPTATFNSKWMESFAEENGEDVIYWEIDWIGNNVCRKYEYTTNKKEKIHIYYECEDYSSGFYVIMNPETGRCTIWEDGH